MSAATQDIASEIEKDGPFAFPFVATGVLCTGMTLRDYFAAKALAALIGKDGKEPENRGQKAVPILAKFAYEYADAMLAAREAA